MSKISEEMNREELHRQREELISVLMLEKHEKHTLRRLPTGDIRLFFQNMGIGKGNEIVKTGEGAYLLLPDGIIIRAINMLSDVYADQFHQRLLLSTDNYVGEKKNYDQLKVKFEELIDALIEREELSVHRSYILPGGVEIQLVDINIDFGNQVCLFLSIMRRTLINRE